MLNKNPNIEIRKASDTDSDLHPLIGSRKNRISEKVSIVSNSKNDMMAFRIS